MVSPSKTQIVATNALYQPVPGYIPPDLTPASNNVARLSIDFAVTGCRGRTPPGPLDGSGEQFFDALGVQNKGQFQHLQKGSVNLTPIIDNLRKR
jgi:hypothetical protein